MNEIQIFNNPRFGEIRTAMSDNQEPLFCLADVCKAVGIANHRNVKTRLDEEDVRSVDTLTAGGNQLITFVTESGLYDVILRSDSENAKPFRKWVTSEVLPAIRKTGGYMVAKESDTPEDIMARALVIAQETLNRKEKRIAELNAANNKLQIVNAEQRREIEEAKPAVAFTDAVSAAKSSCLVGELAKVLRQNGIGMGQNKLFEWLRSNGYLGKQGEYYNLPNQRYVEQGLFEIKKGVRSGNDGVMRTTTTTKVTAKGQIYFINKFLRK